MTFPRAGSLAGCFVCCLSAEEIVAHSRSQTVEAVVGAFANLAGVVVTDEAPGERRLEDVVAERVLDDFALGLEPVEKFLKELGAATPEPVEMLKVTKSSLPEETQVVLLTPSA